MSGYLLKFKEKYSVKIGGRRYPVVKIGNQLWMSENLDWKFPYNGGTLPVGGSSGTPSTEHAWYYNNDETTYGIDGTYKCGLLYNWYATMYLENNKSTLLPEGWHVPSASEWNILIATATSSQLRATDNLVTENWPSGWNGTNDYGFNVLPAGRYNGSFLDFNGMTVFWTSTSVSGKGQSIFVRNYDDGTISYMYYNGNSIRLVKDIIQ